MYNQTLNDQIGAFSAKMNRQYTRRSPELRFFDKVQKQPNGCWEWTAFRLPSGHGQFARIDGVKVELAHRASYAMFVGPIPDGAVVRHKCDNPPCVNPAHLEIGTQADNVADMVNRWRTRSKLTPELVAEIKAARGEKSRDVAARYGFKSHKSILNIWHGRTFSDVSP